MKLIKKYILIFLALLFPFFKVQCQNGDSLQIKQQTIDYPFIIQDSPARLFTMRQINQDYLSGFRILSPLLSKSLSPIINYAIQSASFVLLLGPLTHEEGHRSILLSKNIGSISQPFFLSKRGGFVDGVTDQTLMNLRNTNFPFYMRLYTAGLESDYMLTFHEETLLAFEDETYKNIVIEYLLRKTSLITYFLIGFVHYDIDGNEESDELKRDIVGNDVYGMARHLYRPTMPFYRYTRYNDLTSEEKDFVHKLGYRSFYNLVNLNIIGIRNFTLSPNLIFNAGMGHTICPFGDFIDENFWLKYQNNFKINAYFRQYLNRNNWFPAGGLGINDFQINNRIATTIQAHVWKQPMNLGFDENIGKTGGAIDVTGKYYLFLHHPGQLKRFSFDAGIIYKTSGFLPEEVYMQKHFGFRLGASFGIDR